MRGFMVGCFGVAAVMYAANYASIEADKGNNWTCVIIGVLATGGGLALLGAITFPGRKR